jgi:hypothetical protein
MVGLSFLDLPVRLKAIAAERPSASVTVMVIVVSQLHSVLGRVTPQGCQVPAYDDIAVRNKRLVRKVLGDDEIINRCNGISIV